MTRVEADLQVRLILVPREMADDARELLMQAERGEFTLAGGKGS